MGILDPPSTNTTTTTTTTTTTNPSRSSSSSRSSLFSSSSTSSSSSNESYTPTTRRTRETCYAARDAFFACLDEHGIIDSVREQSAASAACGPADEALMRECAMSWVTYFKQRRVMEWKKRATLEKLVKEGAGEVDMKGGGPGAGVGTGR